MVHLKEKTNNIIGDTYFMVSRVNHGSWLFVAVVCRRHNIFLCIIVNLAINQDLFFFLSQSWSILFVTSSLVLQLTYLIINL